MKIIAKHEWFRGILTQYRQLINSQKREFEKTGKKYDPTMMFKVFLAMSEDEQGMEYTAIRSLRNEKEMKDLADAVVLTHREEQELRTTFTPHTHGFTPEDKLMYALHVKLIIPMFYRLDETLKRSA